jgi:hypothetical protein
VYACWSSTVRGWLRFCFVGPQCHRLIPTKFQLRHFGKRSLGSLPLRVIRWPSCNTLFNMIPYEDLHCILVIPWYVLDCWWHRRIWLKDDAALLILTIILPTSSFLTKHRKVHNRFQHSSICKEALLLFVIRCWTDVALESLVEKRKLSRLFVLLCERSKLATLSAPICFYLMSVWLVSWFGSVCMDSALSISLYDFFFANNRKAHILTFFILLCEWSGLARLSQRQSASVWLVFDW